jgi:hypothetical protein
MQDPLYLIFGLVAGIIGYIIWSFPSSTDVWLECNRKIHKISSNEDDLLCLFGILMERVDEKELELMATITRRIWLHMNFVVYGGDLVHSFQLVKSPKESVEEFYQAIHAFENNTEENNIKEKL